MLTRERAVAIALALIMVTAAGCAGWGTDGPANDQQENETQDPGQEEDVEEANTSGDSAGASDDGNVTESENESSASTDDGGDSSPDSGDATPSSGDGSEDADDGASDGSDAGTDGGSDTAGDGSTDGGDSDANAGDGDTDNDSNSGADGDDGDSGDTDDGAGDGANGDDGSDPETHTLTVTVYDHEGNPLPDASVSVVTDPGTGGGEDVGAATTNADGTAEFQVEDGAYEVSASHDEYRADGIAGPVDVQGEDTSVDVTMPADDGNGDGDPETHTLTVNLANHDIDGVAVTVERDGGPDEEPETRTKASAGGQVSFHDLEPGLYYVDAEGYNQTMMGIEVDEEREITLQQPGPDPIQVTVVDAETGEPIEGAEVSGLCQLWYSSGDAYVTGTTDANGVAQAQADVAPTECNARVDADGYETTHLRLSVPDDDGITVELTPAPTDDDGNNTVDENETAVQAVAS